MVSTLVRELQLDVLRYGQVWEDHRLLEGGLHVGPGDDVLSITSGGCNVLNLLLLEPRSVTALDASPAQSALLELKLAAIRKLDHEGLVALLGYRDGDRLALYRRARSSMPTQARAFWDARQDSIREGVAGAGRLESYFREFRETHLQRLVEPGAVAAFLALDDPRARKRFFRAHIGTPAFAQAYRGYFGRATMARKGRHEAQFRYVRIPDLGEHNWQRFRALCERSPPANPYLEMFLTGRYHDLEQAPPYLQPGNFARLQDLVDRVRVITGPLEHLGDWVPPESISKANLSDAFEYMSARDTGTVLADIARALRPGGRVAYWNLFVPRSRPTWLGGRLRPRRALAQSLQRQDRVWFYSDFHVEERTAA